MAEISTALALYDNFNNKVSQAASKTEQLSNSLRRLQSIKAINIDTTQLVTAEKRVNVISEKVTYQSKTVVVLSKSYSEGSSKLVYQSIEATKLERQITSVSAAQLKLEANYSRSSAVIEKERSSAEKVKAPIQQAADNQNKLNNSINKGSSSMGGFVGKIGNLIKSNANLESVKKIADMSDQYVLTNQRLSLVNDNLQTSGELQNMVFNSAQRSRSAYSDTAQTVAKLGLLGKDAFSGNKETIRFAELMNKSFKLGGASIQDQASGMDQLTQAMSEGKLQGDAFPSIMENAPMLAQAMSAYTGKSVEELKKMGSEGDITSAMIKNSLFAAEGDINSKFDKLPRTWAEVVTSVKNQSQKIFEPVLLKINEIANNPGFGNLINGVTNGLKIVSTAAFNLLKVIMDVAGFFQNNWGIISPIIFGIASSIFTMKAVTAGFNLVQGISNIIQKVSNGLKLAGAVATAIYKKATLEAVDADKAKIAAQLGLNEAMLTCPITWIIIAIIALIAIIYLAVSAYNKLAGTSISAVGVVIGVFSALGIFIYDIVAHLWNYFAAIAEFFVNVWEHPIYSVKRLFANFAINVYDILIALTSGCDSFATNMANAIIDGINIALNAWNKFVDILNTFKIADKLGLKKAVPIEHTTSITSDLKNLKSYVNDWVGEAPEGYDAAPKMNMKSVGDAYNWGYKKGQGLESSFNKMFNDLDISKLTEDVNKSPFSKDAVNYVTDDGLNNKLSGISDQIDVSNEHLEMMRDIAEQNSIQSFVSLTPTVQVTTGDIKEEADVNKIISKIVDYMEGELENNAEGLYA